MERGLQVEVKAVVDGDAPEQRADHKDEDVDAVEAECGDDPGTRECAEEHGGEVQRLEDAAYAECGDGEDGEE